MAVVFVRANSVGIYPRYHERIFGLLNGWIRGAKARGSASPSQDASWTPTGERAEWSEMERGMARISSSRCPLPGNEQSIERGGPGESLKEQADRRRAGINVPRSPGRLVPGSPDFRFQGNGRRHSRFRRPGGVRQGGRRTFAVLRGKAQRIHSG